MRVSFFLFLRIIDDECLSREEHTSHRDGIFESTSFDFGWIDDTSPYEIFVLIHSGIVSIVSISVTCYLIDYHGSLFPGIVSDLSDRVGEGACDDIRTDLLCWSQLRSLERSSSLE